MPSKVAKNRNDHDVNVLYSGRLIQYPESQGINLDRFDRRLFRIDNGIPILQSEYTHDPTKLPQKEDGTLWITPKLIATLYAGVRNDFVYPASHPKDGAFYKKEKNTPEHVTYFRKPGVLVGYPS